MIDVKSFNFFQETKSFFRVSKSEMSESHHQIAMDSILQSEVTVPDEEVWQ